MIPRLSGWTAALIYTAATIVMTWPLAPGLGRDVPFDFGDSLLNCWILDRVATSLTRLLAGDVEAFRQMWHANIFYPAPLTLAYSEHLTAQALQILPLYATTQNPILAYNVLFLSTFVLSGLGAFLLVRHLTGDPAAALVAGLFYAFALPRVAQITHLQVLSSQWMPFALLGLHRYFATGRALPLAGASAALVAQNLSCGYYLLFFAPLFLMVVAWEMVSRHCWHDRRVWLHLAGAAIVVGALTLPFLWPYQELRNLGAGPRRLEEVESFAADAFSFLTASPQLRLWGSRLQVYPRPEGELFPSFTVLVLGGAGVVLAFARRAAAAGLYAVLAALSALLALGPSVHVGGVRLFTGPYALLYHFVPGFDGLRVPARFGMLVCLFLAVLAGMALHATHRRLAVSPEAAKPTRGRTTALRARTAGLIAPLAAAMFLVEAAFLPMMVNQLTEPFAERLRRPPPRVETGRNIPPIYRAAASLPDRAVLIELPFGELEYEVRYVYYSIWHRRPLVNGFSGGFPERYLRIRDALVRELEEPDAAWRALAASEATHVIVHRDAYRDGDADRVIAWLWARGATPGPDTGGAILMKLPFPDHAP